MGLERVPVIILKAARLFDAENIRPANLLLARGDAGTLGERLAPRSLAGIYLNFSDPWPKKRHAKRRLVHRDFLAIYDRLLQPGATIEFKTDQQPLFDFLLEEIAAFRHARMHAMTRNLLGEAAEGLLRADNVQTEYEKKFVAAGNPIFKAVFSLSSK